MRIEDRLEDAGRALRSSVAGDGADDALSAMVDGSPRGAGGARWMLLVAAAVVAVLAGLVGVVTLGGDDERLVADEGEPTETSAPELTTTSPPDTVTADIDIVAEQLGISSQGSTPGTIAFIGIEDAFADQWAAVEPTGALPAVDFGTRSVLAFTLSPEATCVGIAGLLAEDNDVLTPVFTYEGTSCRVAGGPVTVFVAVDRHRLPPTFDLVLDELVDGAGPYTLFVDTSENFASFTPPQEPSGGNLVPGAPDLEQPEPGREITFDGIGDVTLGQAMPVSEVQVYEGRAECGYWGPGEPSHDGDEPLDGVVAIDGDRAEVRSINVRRNPRYRTASGVGVGTTLGSLQRVYGDDLVVDRADASNTPTDGLTGQYSDVAAVRNGERALTFQLSGDVVFGVKLSDADFWGDDEGCA